MKIFKFGGSSIVDASGVRNLAHIVSAETGDLVVVVSAMGKMTNLLEQVCDAFYHGRDASEALGRFRRFHEAIMSDLFAPKASVYGDFEAQLCALSALLAEKPSLRYDYEYDRIVSFGEMVSSVIIAAFLNENGVKAQRVDVRTVLKGDESFRNANIDFEQSLVCCKQVLGEEPRGVFLTQGFLAGTPSGGTATLGREGSDYTAALFASLLAAESVTIWKDVQGVMTADPKLFPEAEIISRMSYKEAIELSHFGAKVIHPKTIKPLQNRQIPLYVRSYIKQGSEGTVITEMKDEQLKLPPILIEKEAQVLMTLSPRDFSFIAEERLGQIFSLLAHYRLKLNLMQNSAISFTLCVDYHPAIFDEFVAALQKDFVVKYNERVHLITIRHYTDPFIARILGERIVLVEQRSRLTAQFVVTES